MVGNRLTAGFSSLFSPFILFLGILIFIVGVVVISFMVFVMMTQKIKDIGLMKAAGCPNDMIFGYFMTELVLVALVGCSLGVILGLLADFASASLFNGIGLQIPQGSVNYWLVLMVFTLFIVFALIFGAKPVLDAAKVEPVRALSPTFHFGLSKEPGFKIISKSGVTLKIALRSLFRRKSATVRVVLCLTAVFMLVTVAVAGGIIAESTTKNWVERAIGRDVILIGHRDMVDRYELLLSKFYVTNGSSQFNYADEKWQIPDGILSQLMSTAELKVDPRLVVEAQVYEIQGITYGPQTSGTTYIGDNRSGTSLIVGVDPKKALGEWFLRGEFLADGANQEAVLGDTTAQKLFSVPLNQSAKLFGTVFRIVGVCLDPINNGNVTYIPLETLQNVTGVTKPNIIMARITASANRTSILGEIRADLSAANPEFEAVELNDVLDKSLGFLSYVWSSLMLLPLFSLIAASLCLIGYVMLSITEQRQEFGTLRAIGARPGSIVKIVAGQSLIVSIASCMAGIAFGIIVTLMILIPEPNVTGTTVIEIAAWLLIAFTGTFIFSLLPTVRFARKPVLEIIT
jgi:ABC-type antimicrobial peptide transport system permease subunit